MDLQDRKKILDNLELLERKTQNFDDVFEKLVQKRMFNEYMKNEILAHPDKVKFFFKYVTTRGPDAFKQLLNVMTSTDNGHIAAFLTDGKISGCKVTQSGNSSNELPLDEEFPHNPDIIWRVRQGINRYDFNREEVYKMGSKPKGLVLIVNIRSFVNGTKDERLGSEHDIKRLKDTFEQIGYQVIVEDKDLTAEGILEAVKTFAKRDEHWKCDSCIVVIMSHGTFHPTTTSTINFLGWDTSTVNSEAIIRQFHGNKCRALAGKPKIFFFQACRGDELNFTVAKILETDEKSPLVKKETINDKENEELNFKFNSLTITDPPEVCQKRDIKSSTQTNTSEIHPLSENFSYSQQMIENSCDSEYMNGNGFENQLAIGNKLTTMTDAGLITLPPSIPTVTGDRIRSDADIFIGYSTTPGHVSRRDPDTGSWFIQILCQMIARHAWNKDISTILEHTDRGILKKTDFGTVQSIDAVNILTKKFYFQPGIYDY